MIWYGGREGAHQPMVRMVRGATVDYIRNHLELCAAVLEPTKHYVLLTGFRGLSKLKKMGVIMTPPPCTPFARTPRAPPSVLAYDYTYNTLEQSSNT
jgi:hypothetical protein